MQRAVEQAIALFRCFGCQVYAAVAERMRSVDAFEASLKSAKAYSRTLHESLKTLR
jgi:hypothetical protein